MFPPPDIPASSRSSAFLRMEGISKRFALVKANDYVDLKVERGEIHALVGENGAGKSTLMRILYGLYRPDSGRIFFDGERADIRTPSDAIALGVGMVHQHFMLVPQLSVAENVVLGSEPSRSGVFLDLQAASRKIEELSRLFALSVDPRSLVEKLSVGAQQRVEILKILFRGAELLILDEPTAVLTPQETEALFVILRRMKEQGKTIVFITHKLGEVMQISDRVTVMRHGRVVGVVHTKDSSPAELAMLMVGRRVLFDVEKRPAASGPVVLELADVHALGASRVPRLKGLSLSVRAGEILGLAGVEGNGQTELVEVAAGLRKPTSGRILLKGEDVTGSSPRRMLELGVAHIPEDRLKRGLITEFSVGENLILGSQFRHPYGGRVFLDSRAVLANAERTLREFDVRPRAPFLRAGSLSGGNQQKLVVARELGRKPALLLAAQPTRGVDIGAIEFIRRCLVSQRDAGTAVLLVSADLSEILSVSDRIAVIYDGRIVSTVEASATDEKELGLLMTGAGGRGRGPTGAIDR